MSYQVSARKYRPQTFAEVVGQPHIVRTLCNAIEAGRVAHAYLFSGVRGVGKTTVARVFAKALNCENGPTTTPCNTCEPCRQVTHGDAADVLEIDGASNNGVDAVRDLTDNIRYRPLSCRYKIYIIDEVHMLSTAAFNALLKTLEEPPDHAVFMFATTETHKIPRTILSRCQHHAFRRISREEIAAQLAAIANQDAIPVSAEAIALLAKAADGSMRDGLSLFDQAVSFGGGTITPDDLILMLGVVGQETLDGFAYELLNGDTGAALTRLKQLINAGHDLQVLAAELVEHFRNLLMCQVSDTPGDLMELSADDVAELQVQAQAVPQEVIQQVLSLLSDAQEKCRRALNPRFILEAALVRAAQAPELVDLAALLGQLDDQLGDNPVPRPARQVPPRPARQAAPERPQPSPPPATPPPSHPTAAAPPSSDTKPAPPRYTAPQPPPAMESKPAAPVASEPVASEPVASEPVASEPVASEPVAPVDVPSAPTATTPEPPVRPTRPVRPVEPSPIAEAAPNVAIDAPTPPPVQPPSPQPEPTQARQTEKLPPWQGPPPGESGSAYSETPPDRPEFSSPPRATPEVRMEEAATPSVPSQAPATPSSVPPATPEPVTPVASAPTTPAATTPTTPTGPPQGFDSANDLWLHIIDEVRKRRPALASYLEQGALQQATDNMVKIGYLSAFEVIHGMVTRTENVEFIARMATEVTGRSISINFCIVEEHRENVTTLAQEFEAKEAAAHQREIEDTMQLPFVKEVLDTFGGEITELRKPDK